MPVYVPSTLITEVRAVTDHDTDTQVTDAQILSWMDPILQALQRQCADLAPDLFTAVSDDFAIAAGASSQDLASAPLSLGDVLGKIRSVERKQSATVYYAIPQYHVLVGTMAASLSWRQLGETTILFRPPLAAPGTYRVQYLLKCPPLALVSTAFSVPHGADSVIVERLAAKVRMRFEEDPTPHVNAANQAWKDLRAWLIRQSSTPARVWDVTGRYR